MKDLKYEGRIKTVDLIKNIKIAKNIFVNPYFKRYFCKRNSERIYLKPPLSFIILFPAVALTSDLSKLIKFNFAAFDFIQSP